MLAQNTLGLVLHWLSWVNDLNIQVEVSSSHDNPAGDMVLPDRQSTQYNLMFVS